MKISSHVENSRGRHHVSLRAGDTLHALEIAPRPTGFGSTINGGELLLVALATCYCNDIYREAAHRGLKVERVAVDVEGEFGAEGEPARNVTYRARVEAQGTEADIRALMLHTDTVAEIQNTLRAGTPISLAGIEAVTV